MTKIIKFKLTEKLNIIKIIINMYVFNNMRCFVKKCIRKKN
jgi:hypothetical protein